MSEASLQIPRRVYKGRSRVLSSATVIDETNVVDQLNHALNAYASSVAEIDYLHNYFLGNQPVLSRKKPIRPTINNPVVENRAYQITKDRADSLVGEPVTYSVRGTGAKTHGDLERAAEEADELSHRVQRLNECCVAADKHACDTELVQWMCECGIGYRIILPTEAVAGGGERPFVTASLDPRSTMVVRTNDVFKEPIFAVNTVVSEVTNAPVHTIYTTTQRFVVEKGRLISVGENPLGQIPIIEYEANPERMGVFEAVLSLFDAINEVESNRVDGIAQFIQSLFVFENVDMDTDEWEEMLAKGALLISSNESLNAKVYALNAELNQDQTQTLVDSLYRTALSICGMPYNMGGSASTSDTGAAVTMRDGWSNSENRCKETETMFKRSERRFIDCALSILKTAEHIDLSSSQIEIKFTRRNYEAIQSKAQVLTTMLGSGQVHPRLAFEHCGMFSDPEAAYDASSRYVDELRALETAIPGQDLPGSDSDAKQVAGVTASVAAEATSDTKA
ncbi:phage portal protein [Collinsella sp. AGMB00827]|uniref:Phage portal protein n=1 Tax=Collinsella ureilytica TaxID=2869515 RepID=A0ABS7MLV1_9ACTN|nr:phage portal protein [Collinsella urealyticum]MBY4798345.1 phage portal protein [Collinsella urealyticum]